MQLHEKRSTTQADVTEASSGISEIDHGRVVIGRLMHRLGAAGDCRLPVIGLTTSAGLHNLQGEWLGVIPGRR